jgi:glutamate synthase domain-containing protein 2
LLDFAEAIAGETGLPVGIKSAVGDLGFWRDLARLTSTTRSLDFVTIDGGEGGTGAAPLVFADHVGLPFKIGFSRVQHVFAERGLQERLVFVGSGKLGFPESALVAFTLGCDLVNVGREALLAIRCIQAQRCHTNHCPTGVTTQNWWLSHGLDPALKCVRLANYVVTLRKELLTLSRACGVTHPSAVSAEQIEILDDKFGARSAASVFGGRGVGLPQSTGA